MIKLIALLLLCCMMVFSSCKTKVVNEDVAENVTQKEWKRIAPDEISENGVKMFSDVSSDRYTYEFMEHNPYFTVLSFPEGEKDKVMYLGTHSGRDSDDKIKDAGLTIEYTDRGNVRFDECNRCIECRTIYKQEFIRDLIDPDIAQFYDNGTGMHSMYIGEIVNVWEK